ncbi:putative bacteriocin export ABC transporter [Gemella cuniculi]|uniref:putative bacteriocin export ABC transporter n=1 Tax=Gemella cuniculi TaxID=150240 RepID=UPI000417A6D7|nr:putative bacteriocin export ABC transporter [Gemella cuniculi]
MIKIENITKKFDEKNIFENFNLIISTGELIAITGASGSGKTTLINMIGGLEECDSGNITINDIEINKKNKVELYRNNISWLFQNFALVDEWTVFQNLVIALKFKKYKSSKEHVIKEVLKKVGLEDKLKSKIFTLSGGEQQRVSLARVMLQDNNIILADEPTGSLDEENRNIVFDILKNMQKNGKTVVIVTHDKELAKMCDRIVTL